MANSTIGEYVHLNWGNYQKYGVTRKDKSSAKNYNYSVWKNDFKADFLRKQEVSAPIENLETRVNSFIADLSTNPNAPVNQAITNKVYQIMGEKYGEKLGSIDFSTLDVYEEDNVPILKTKIVQKIKTDKNKARVNLSSFKKAIEQLQTGVEAVKNTNRFDEVSKRVSDLEKRFNALSNRIKSANSRVVLKGDLEGINLANDINSALRCYFVGSSIPNQKGDLLELVLALFATEALKGTKKQILEKIQSWGRADLLGGEGKGRATLDASTLSSNPNFQKAMEQKGYRLDIDSNTYISLHPSANKIDGVFHTSLDPEIGRDLSFSAKNAASGLATNTIKIVDEISMLSILNERVSKATNHYLNATAEHADEQSSSRAFARAHNDVKYLILTQALLGKTSRGAQAEVFVVNDNSKPVNPETGEKKIKIINMADILSEAYKIGIDKSATFYANRKRLDTVRFENKRQGAKNKVREADISKRITLLQLGLHEQKITAYLRKDALASFKDS